MTKKFRATGAVEKNSLWNPTTSLNLRRSNRNYHLRREKNVQHACAGRINGLNNAWLVNSVYLRCHRGWTLTKESVVIKMPSTATGPTALTSLTNDPIIVTASLREEKEINSTNLNIPSQLSLRIVLRLYNFYYTFLWIFLDIVIKIWTKLCIIDSKNSTILSFLTLNNLTTIRWNISSNKLNSRNLPLSGRNFV